MQFVLGGSGGTATTLLLDETSLVKLNTGETVGK